ncbi:MAG TPA: DUF3108 domain-containing protein, partial [Dissulfurispiraceae bacterium]|nr:DUF3108 domain-containing protein [Dissulfurispiraceae bacterium]
PEQSQQTSHPSETQPTESAAHDKNDSASRPQSHPSQPAPAAPVARPVQMLDAKKETLQYDIYWSGVYVGKASIEASRDENSMLIISRARSAGVIAAFYTVDDHAQSILINNRPYAFTFRQHEGKNRSDKETRFDYDANKIAYSNAVKNVRSEHDLPNFPMWDILSGFYYARFQPLETGQKFSIDVFDSGKIGRVGVETLKKEQIEVPNMGTVRTVLIKPNVETEGLFKKKGDILIWLTDDAQRIPVRVETVIPIGKVSAELRGRIVEK